MQEEGAQGAAQGTACMACDAGVRFAGAVEAVRACGRGCAAGFAQAGLWGLGAPVGVEREVEEEMLSLPVAHTPANKCKHLNKTL